jgi:hypothetical protein
MTFKAKSEGKSKRMKNRRRWKLTAKAMVKTYR